MGYSFSLGLSFLVGGSILKTTIAPTWNDIGQLAAIIRPSLKIEELMNLRGFRFYFQNRSIAIRKVLNYLLLQAIDKSGNDSKEQALLSEEQSTDSCS